MSLPARTEATKFRPINEDHAIESVKFAVTLSDGMLPRVIFALERAHAQWAEGLPAVSSADANVETGGRAAKAPGVMFAYVRPDASPIWSMTLVANRIEIDCFLYSRWKKVWSTAGEYLSKAIKVIASAQPDLRVVNAELSVKDVFVSTAGEYSLESIFPRSKRFPDFIYEIGPVWHCNTGWFDPISDDGSHLHNLNCDTVPAREGFLINTMHFQRRTFSEASSLQVVSQELFGRINVAMMQMHLRNKDILGNILHPELVKLINLK